MSVVRRFFNASIAPRLITAISISTAAKHGNSGMADAGDGVVKEAFCVAAGELVGEAVGFTVGVGDAVGEDVDIGADVGLGVGEGEGVALSLGS